MVEERKRRREQKTQNGKEEETSKSHRQMWQGSVMLLQSTFQISLQNQDASHSHDPCPTTHTFLAITYAFETRVTNESFCEYQLLTLPVLSHSTACLPVSCASSSWLGSPQGNVIISD